jgi:hypothetical protein
MLDSNSFTPSHATIDCDMAGPYDDAVFSGHTFLPIEFLRIGVITFLYTLAIFGWGAAICRWFAKLDDSPTNFLATRLVVGCVALYVAFIALSAAAILRPASVAIVLIAGLASGLFHASQAVGKLREVVVETRARRRDEKALVLIVCILALLQIACGFTPLTFYDSQVYHLLAPVEFLKAGSLVHIPWNVLTNGPLALQLTFGMSWIADPTGGTFKLLMTLFGGLSILGAARIGSELGFRSAMIAALFVLSYPEFWVQQTFGAVDLPIASFLIFGTIWWIQAVRQQDWTWTLLSGIAFGCAVASRYQALVLVVWIMSAVVVAECFRKYPLTRVLLKCAAVAAMLAVLVSPWLLRNYSNFGNPVYPLMYGSLGGSEWSPDQDARLHAEVMGTSLSELAPGQMIVGSVGALLMTPSNGLFGLGLLLGSLIAVSAGARNIRIYGALGIGGLIIWGLIHPTSGVQLLRFNAASLVLMLACTGAILGSSLFQESKGVYIAAALTLGSFLIGITALHGIVPVWNTLTSAAARTAYSRANIPSWQVFEFANGKLDPARHRVLLLGETRAVWLKIPFLAPSALNGPQLTQVLPAAGGVNDWFAQMHRLGVTHILICSSEWQRLADAFGYFRLPDDHLKRFTDWLHTLPVVFDDRHGDVLLEMPAA